MYVNSPVLLRSSYSTPPLAPLTDRNKPAVWAATPREAGWIPIGWVLRARSCQNIHVHQQVHGNPDVYLPIISDFVLPSGYLT